MLKALTQLSKSEPRTKQEWLRYEGHAYREGAAFPAGVDEVGRGCLAGPVVAAAVILPRRFYVAAINDSKKLSAGQRESAFRIITQNALCWGIAMIEAPEIDEINILQASLKAMKFAVEKLSPLPDWLLVDGRDAVPQLNIRQSPIIGGDGRSASIAAASILAKVTRDRLMRFYSRRFPQYGFQANKGYGTRTHWQALDRFGPCALHRRSFASIGERVSVNASKMI